MARIPPVSLYRGAARLALSLSLLGCLAAFGAAELLPQELRQAEALYQADKLMEAERLYDRAASGSSGAGLRLCLERLLTIYVRLGRYDRAIQLAQRYEPILRQDKDSDRLRQLTLEIGAWYLALGHARTAEQYLRRGLEEPDLDPGKTKPLPPSRRLAALAHLALAADGQGDRARAGQYWKQVEEHALTLLQGREVLTAEQRIECVRKLGESYRFQGRPDKAIPPLTALLSLLDEAKDFAGKRDTLKLLAELLVTRKDYGEAVRTLREALELQQRHEPADLLAHGDLAVALAEALRLQDQKNTREIQDWEARAVADYLAVLDSSRTRADQEGLTTRSSKQVAGAVAAFWKLQQLLQKSQQYRQALQLTLTQGEQWQGGLLLEARLKEEQGSLNALLGAYAQAREPLRVALADLETYAPLNLLELPRVLNNLALVELSTDNPGRARELGLKSLALARDHQLAPSPLGVETLNLLGTCETQAGDYARAIDYFRQGVALCKQLGTAANGQRCSLLLNMALLYKAQSDLSASLSALQEALLLFRSLPEPSPLGEATFAAAEANLLAAQGQLAEADARARRVLELCQGRVEDGPLLMTAQHCQALYLLQRGELSKAEEIWRLLLQHQQKGKQALLLPCTLNYLGLTQECRHRDELAEPLYRQALEVQRGNPRAFPVTHFITLWRLANVLERSGRPSEAMALLEEAIGVIEVARLNTYGDAKQRAAFFNEAAPAFEQLVEWRGRAGDTEAVFATVTRSRSRTLFDQLQMKRVDPRAELQGEHGKELRQQEQQLRQRISALRAQAQLVPVSAYQTEKAAKLLTDFDEAQQSYAEVWREIFNASPVYRQLENPEAFRKTLPLLRARLLGPRKMLLVYFVGRERSFLLLQAGDTPKPELFPLQVPATVAARVAPPRPITTEEALSHSARGFALERLGPQPAAPAQPSASALVPLGQVVLRSLVEHYLLQISHPSFDPTAGIRYETRNPEEPPLVQRTELLTDLLLPPEVRKRIRDFAPEVLLVIPDGPLHKLPLEALVVASEPEPRYVLDELPPLVYAPSAALLAHLAERPRLPARPLEELSLLTVGNPAYPQDTTAKGLPGAGPATALGFRGQLPLLESTAEESRRVAQLFDARQVTQLTEKRATKKAVLAALPTCQVVHLAVHGFADKDFGNLFGALALAPPAAGQEDDSFLSLHEIYQLQLPRCELAALSACVTNVGPQQPLEAGVTLAHAFLMAGARRVVASHWSVADDSTAELMVAFFAQIKEASKTGDALPYARALQQARKMVRGKDKRWAAPYYWAPFVLLGPGD